MQLNTDPLGRRRTARGSMRAKYGVDETGRPSGAGGSTASNATEPPVYMGGMFPGAATYEFPTIEAAPYNFTDPQKYAEKFAAFNRGEVTKNFGQAKGMALEALDTELQGLQRYAPAAAALKREQTSIDNVFNQQERTRQVNNALPFARPTLDAQRGRAASYAAGRLPDETLDRALELGTRSRGADAATFGGFGARSGAAAKISDLMSADQRFQISQYGEGLTSSNLNQEAGLFLAPTEYSNAGQGINVAPEVGAGRLAYQGLNTLNSATVLDPAQALTATIQQEQFGTNLEQQTRTFNATGVAAARQFNASTINDFALAQFGYEVSYANAYQAAGQHELDVGAGLIVAGAENAGTNEAIQSSQTQQGGAAVTQAAGSIPGAISAIDQAIGGGDSGGVTDSGGNISTDPNTGSTTAPLNDSGGTQVGKIGSGVGGGVSSAGVDPAAPAALRFSDGVAAPAGYTPVSNSGDGTYTAVPTAAYENELSRFASTNQLPSGSVSVPNAAAADMALSAGTGMSYQPLPNYRPIGIASTGTPLFAPTSLIDNPNTALGANANTTLATSIASLGVTDESFMRPLGEMGAVLANPETFATLDNLYATRGNGAVAQGILNTLVKDPVKYGTNAGQQVAFMAQRIGDNWGMMSPAQKSLSLAALANGPALEMKSGKNVGSEVVPGSNRSVVGGLKVGDALSLVGKGRNGYALARNWNQLSTIAHIATGTRGVTQIANESDKMGLTGYGRQGAAVKIEPGMLRKLNAVPAPSYGVGAIALDSPRHIPAGYTQVGVSGKKVVAVPEAHKGTISGKFALNDSVNSGAHPAMRLWGSSPSGSISRGAAGGSAIISGLDRMVQTNPSLVGATIAHSLFNNVLGRSNG